VSRFKFRPIVSVACTVAVLAAVSVMPASANEMRPLVLAHASSPTHVYVVNTTSDDLLYSGAPAHRCEDKTNVNLCSFRAAVTAASNDFSTTGVWDKIQLPSGTFTLNPAVDIFTPSVVNSGALTIQGAGAANSIISASILSFDNEILDFDTEYGNLSLNGISMRGGQGSDGGAVFVDSYSSLTVNNSSFLNDSASSDGGAIDLASSSSASITNSSFQSNEATYSGGAIYSAATTALLLTGDTFKNNTVTSTSSTSNKGGAVYATGDVQADNDTFSSNAAYGAGGAIFVHGDGQFNNDTFSANRTTDSTGGGIDADENLTLTNSHFSNNQAWTNGGAVYNNYAGVFTNDTFTSNNAADGGDIYDDDSAGITNSTFHNSHASESGGAIYVGFAYAVTLANDSFNADQAAGTGASDGGGALYVNEGFAFLNSVTMSAAKATGGAGGGGAIFCYNCELQITSSTLTNNTTTGSGGAIYSDHESYLNIHNSILNSNMSAQGGAIFENYYGQSQIDGSTFNGNKSTVEEGGAIDLYDSSYLSLDQSTLSNNSALGLDGYGGALAMITDSTAEVSQVTFANNHAEYAGGIYLLSSSTLNISYSSVVDNVADSASGYGGGIYNNGSAVWTTATVWAGNNFDQCAGNSLSDSGGYNFVSDHSCYISGIGDIVGGSAKLGVLANNGGPTQTVEPLSGSPLIGGGGSGCPGDDQRGVAVPASQPCDIGAVFVEATKTTLNSSASSLRFGHEQSATFSVTVSPAVSGMSPAGKVAIMAGSKLLCLANLTRVSGSKAVKFKGSCSPGASTLKKGSFTVTANYVANGIFAESTSAAKSLKITA
jgi:predicted outer membrane repeat protein